MRTFEEVLEECAAPVRAAIVGIDDEIRAHHESIADADRKRRDLEVRNRDATREHRAQDPAIAALREEVAGLDARIRDLQRQAEARRVQLRDAQSRADVLAGELKQVRAGIRSAEDGIATGEARIRALAARREEAGSRLRDASRAALGVYARETFDGFLRSAVEPTARERWDGLMRDYADARERDAALAAAHAEREELRRLVPSAQLPSLRDLLAQRLDAAERAIAARFPGILDGPPAPEEDPLIDAGYWYDAEDDVTRLLLPIPAACWGDPPATEDDPRGAVVCAILWTVVRAVGVGVPDADLVGDLVVLEWHGDVSGNVAAGIFEVSLRADRVVTLLPAPLTEDVREALR